MAEQEYNRLRESPLGEDLYSYLLARNRLPIIKRTHYLGDEVYGNYTPSENLIKLLYGAPDSTRLHEVAHSADNALESQYWNRKTSWGRADDPTPFTDAFLKLKGGMMKNEIPRQDMAKRLSPEWFNKNQDYRATSNELAGWGAGRQLSAGEPGYKVPDHLDSTMATELSILMELAKRNDKPFPKQPGLFERLFGK